MKTQKNIVSLSNASLKKLEKGARLRLCRAILKMPFGSKSLDLVHQMEELVSSLERKVYIKV